MVDLHIHTKYSLLDSNTEPVELIEKIKQQGKKAICITDHGNLYASIEIYKLCRDNAIKYLHGCEVYICDDVNITDKDNRYYHLILISKNEIGRLNLIKLVSLSSKYKYYGKPRIDFSMLEKHHKGLIVLSACMAGEVQRALKNNDKPHAVEIVRKYKKLFGDDYYLEYQSHSDEVQQTLNQAIVNLANELNVEYVVTTDAHYLSEDMQKYHSIFVQIGQSREVGETYNDCYVQSENDVLRICKSTEKENYIALSNTEKIADKCEVIIPLSDPIMQHYDVPDNFNSEIGYLTYLCTKGWKKRKIDLINDSVKKKEYKDRLLYELKAIKEMGFEGYFLNVWDYANSVKRRGIARGSGGGCLVAYLINIVDTDPVKYGLYFERFIDVGALQLLQEGKITKSQLKVPDFDLDFGRDDREKVLQSVIDKHGIDKIASLGSFQYIWAKGAIKDIGKVLNIPFSITNEMTAKLDGETIQEVLELNLLKQYEKKYPELFEYAEKLAGLPKSFSMHPCGKIICEQPVEYYNATEISKTGDIVLQGDMHTAENLGLIKADFLGLRTVDIIYDVLDMIEKDYEYIAPHNLNFEDENVLNNFKNGYTAGVFQFESDGMRAVLKNMQCNSLYDLTVANALYRPGSMAFIDNYVKRRAGIEEYEYLHEDLEHILKDSYAIIVFQEQLIEIGKLAGLSNPDELRQATAKKKPKLMAKIEPELKDGLKKRCWSQEQVDVLWETILAFALYSFNKSHSLAYAIIAYICMFLKTYHPKEFVCAWINSYGGKIEKLPICYIEAKRLGVKVYNAKFGQCKSMAQILDDGVMVGTQTIKFCNAHIADELMELSKNKYNNIVDLLSDIIFKTSVDSRQLKILIILNFFVEFAKNKKLLQVSELIDKLYERKQIKCSDIKKLCVDENVLKKYSGKQTAALYKELDMVGYIKEMTSGIEDSELSIKEQIKQELENLGYSTYSNDKIPNTLYYVMEMKVYKDKTKPYLTLYNLRIGDILKTKITEGKKFAENPFVQGSIINAIKFKEKNKMKMIGGSWVKTSEIEKVLSEWQVM